MFCSRCNPHHTGNFIHFQDFKLFLCWRTQSIYLLIKPTPLPTLNHMWTNPTEFSAGIVMLSNQQGSPDLLPNSYSFSFFFFLLASKDTFLHLEQESANYSQRAKFGPPTRKWSCFGTQSSPYILPLAAFGFTKQSWVVAREILWPAILKYVLSGPTQKKFANPWSRATNIEIQGRSLMSPPTPVPHSLIQLISISSKFYLLNSSSVLFLSLFLLSLRPSLGPYQFYPHYYNILTGLPAIIFYHLKAISTLVSIN